jgi:hypothetical protein
MRMTPEQTPCGATKRTAYRLSKDSQGRSISRVPQLLEYARSSPYFASIKAQGKII